MLFVSAPSWAQAPEPCRCAPFESSDAHFALIVSYNVVGGPGPWLKWACYPQQIPPGATQAPAPTYCTVAAPWSVVDLRKLGDRIETIRASADPLAAFRSSWKRHVTLPLSDPSLKPLRDAIAADVAAQSASAASAP